MILTGLLGPDTCAQNNFPPAGYVAWKDFQDSLPRLKKDFDGDGKAEIIQVFAKEGEDIDRVVAIRMSSNTGVYYFPFDPNSYELSSKGDVLTVGGCFGNGRWCKSLKFRYDKTLAAMRLIGYEEESFGNAAHDGAYVKSINLMTGYMEIEGKAVPKKKKKVVFKPVTLNDLGSRQLERLEKTGREYLKD